MRQSKLEQYSFFCPVHLMFPPPSFFMIFIVETWDLIYEVLLAICNFNVEIEKNLTELSYCSVLGLRCERHNKDGQESRSYFQSFLLKKELESNLTNNKAR